MNIRPVLTSEDQAKVLSINSYTMELKNLNINFTNDNPDVILVHATLLDKSLLEQTHTPLIILERIDSGVVVKKRELKLPNVLGTIKNSIFRPLELHNAECITGRYHCKLMYDLVKDKLKLGETDENIYTESNMPDISKDSPYRTLKIDPTVILSQEDLSKVHVGYSFCHYTKMNELAAISDSIDLNRENDLHFVGTVDYGKNILMTLHRHEAIRQAQKLKCKTILNGGRPQNSSQYIMSLLKTKIVLSPWGHGEVCYRDYEAMFCGCVLLKPDSGYIDSFPDVFRNNISYIPCKADFSDLQEKVDWILSNWNSLKEMRKANLNMVRNARIPKVFAGWMANVFNKCMSNKK